MKKTFKFLLLIFAITLGVLPFATSFNEVLTKAFEGSELYRPIQAILVPYISRLMVGILSRLPGLEIATYPFGVVVNGVDVRITWNCLGWQSFLLFFASLMIGLRGQYSQLSKLQAVLLGIVGTFLLNMFRLVFTAALVGWWRGLFVILFHNYFSAFLTIVWLIFFWWFSYSFVLESKERVQ